MNRFKVLMYNGEYVNERLLHDGVYCVSVPTVYLPQTTKDALIDRSNIISLMHGGERVSESYKENLDKCELVEVEVKVVGNANA